MEADEDSGSFAKKQISWSISFNWKRFYKTSRRFNGIKTAFQTKLHGIIHPLLFFSIEKQAQQRAFIKNAISNDTQDNYC